MKKNLIILALLCMGLSACADEMDDPYNVDMVNFWQKNGKCYEKVMTVGSRILNKNQLDKRVVFEVKSSKIINAYAAGNNKKVTINTGLFPYFDNDDELAYVLSHEIAHELDFYRGVGTWCQMVFNRKQYEFKADAVGIDLMVKAGYNPVAAITAGNKFLSERLFDFGLMTSHPNGSRRLMAMYEYIYKKYPWALDSQMTHDVNYQNFTYSSEKDIVIFKQKEKRKELKLKEANLI